MTRSMRRRMLIAGQGQTYSQKILSLRGVAQGAYYPMSEVSGSVMTEMVAARHAAYSAGVTLNAIAGPLVGGGNAPLFDGNDYATLASLPIPQGEGSISMFIRAYDAEVWNDLNRKFMLMLRADDNNEIHIEKYDDVVGQLRFLRAAGSTIDEVRVSSISSTVWLHLCLTWSTENDRLRAYIDRAQVGATQTGLGTWSGANASLNVARYFSGALFWVGYCKELVIAPVEWTLEEVQIAGGQGFL